MQNQDNLQVTQRLSRKPWRWSGRLNATWHALATDRAVAYLPRWKVGCTILHPYWGEGRCWMVFNPVYCISFDHIIILFWDWWQETHHEISWIDSHSWIYYVLLIPTRFPIPLMLAGSHKILALPFPKWFHHGIRWVIWVGVRFWREPAGWNLKRARWRPTYCCSAMSGMEDLDPKSHQGHLHLRQMRYHVHSFSSCLTQLNRNFLGGNSWEHWWIVHWLTQNFRGIHWETIQISQGQAGPATKKTQDPKSHRSLQRKGSGQRKAVEALEVMYGGWSCVILKV